MLMTKNKTKLRIPYNSSRKHLFSRSQATRLETYLPQEPVYKALIGASGTGNTQQMPTNSTILRLQ